MQRDDVIFFHTGDVPPTAQADVLSLCAGSHARFLQLPPHHFETPPGTPPQHLWRYGKKFSAGYRHMIRFFTSGLWPTLAAEGYTYVMRMDEDSFLWSPIRYNVFAFMERRLATIQQKTTSKKKTNPIPTPM